MVSFILTTEQEELAATAQRFFREQSPALAVRAAMASESGVDWTIWRQLGDLGFLGAAVPEQYGGAGSSFVELMILLEEAGRALLCAPLLASTALAANALLQSADDRAMKAYLPGLATGELIGAVALGADGGQWRPEQSMVAAAEQDGQWFLDGTLSYVIDGHVADLVLAVAPTAAGDCSLFAVSLAGTGIQRQQLPTLDQTRRLCTITLRHAAATLAGAPGRGQEIAERVLQLGAVALAAEQLGGASRCFEITLEHLRIRHQFDRPIGSFQALKHRCADLAMELESARALVMYAARAAGDGTDDLAAAASMAKSYSSDTYFHAAAECIQMLGGIGFTWEHDAHLYFKRATADRLLLGTPEEHNELLLSAIGV